ncbi:Do family serine endopeptidase [Paucibacter sp. B2R-40]|uniref:Do family serine endopeptidase n=1 Tax=Paucibacter sp. B2R-40 TaxID=2893554 RepID=UPI0021E4B675|nr:Do family serine endopeptidase [Paucibacter sp. B2R-40]MCV2355657.1 Do family serine endopeptidase [Paucibacter sp. B2R-40]
MCRYHYRNTLALTAIALALHTSSAVAQPVSKEAATVTPSLSTSTVAPSLAPSAVAPSLARGLPDFTELVERVGPAVVNIRTTAKAKPSEARAEEEEARELLRRYGLPVPRGRSPRGALPGGPADDEPQERGVGSGFIISADGILLTNAHVVDGAAEIFVRLSDKREFKAKLIGADKRSDVAVLSIEASGLPTVKLGDVSRLKVGEWVIAIGSPFNFDNSVSAGIISAKARDTGELLPLIQTDVAINPGNSGGPLINLRGEVVGINSQIYSRSGGYMGISFAIPVDEVERVATQLRAKGRVVRGRIGLRIGELSKEVAESLGLPNAQGALVRGLEPGGPAETAGVEPGDIVTQFNGQPIEKPSDLPRIVSNSAPGSEQQLQVWRRGKPLVLRVKVAELEPEAPVLAQAEPAAKPAVGPIAALGLQLTELNATERKELKLGHGLRVAAAAGPAARAGLREGDVLLALGASDIASAKQLELLLAHSDKRKPLSLLYLREGAAQYALIKPAA